MLFVMAGKRLIVHIRDSKFRSCQGLSPIKMTEYCLITKHWTCKISKGIITCTTSRNIGNIIKRIKTKIFPNGHMESFVTYVYDNNKKYSEHFTKDFDMDMSNITLTLNANADISAHQVDFSS